MGQKEKKRNKVFKTLHRKIMIEPHINSTKAGDDLKCR